MIIEAITRSRGDSKVNAVTARAMRRQQHQTGDKIVTSYYSSNPDFSTFEPGRNDLDGTASYKPS